MITNDTILLYNNIMEHNKLKIYYLFHGNDHETWQYKLSGDVINNISYAVCIELFLFFFYFAVIYTSIFYEGFKMSCLNMAFAL